jgi:hypothetical protein
MKAISMAKYEENGKSGKMKKEIIEIKISIIGVMKSMK